MDHELGEPLAELVQRLLRVDVEVADEVDDQERREEEQDDADRARPAADVPRVEQEARRGTRS